MGNVNGTLVDYNSDGFTALPDYGDLDYSDDGLVEVEVIIAYDYAYLGK